GCPAARDRRAGRAGPAAERVAPVSVVEYMRIAGSDALCRFCAGMGVAFGLVGRSATMRIGGPASAGAVCDAACHAQRAEVALQEGTLSKIPLRAGSPLAPGTFAALRRRAVLEGCKWDPQVGDVSTLSAFP